MDDVRHEQPLDGSKPGALPKCHIHVDQIPRRVLLQIGFRVDEHGLAQLISDVEGVSRNVVRSSRDLDDAGLPARSNGFGGDNGGVVRGRNVWLGWGR